MITAPKNAIAYLVCLISYMCIAPKRNESTFPRAPLRTISDLLTRKATTTSNDEDHESDHWLEHWASRFIYNERLMSAMYLLNLTLWNIYRKKFKHRGWKLCETKLKELHTNKLLNFRATPHWNAEDEDEVLVTPVTYMYILNKLSIFVRKLIPVILRKLTKTLAWIRRITQRGQFFESIFENLPQP